MEKEVVAMALEELEAVSEQIALHSFAAETHVAPPPPVSTLPRKPPAPEI